VCEGSSKGDAGTGEVLLGAVGACEQGGCKVGRGSGNTCRCKRTDIDVLMLENLAGGCWRL
jgi:hypothetical protein